MGDTVLLNPLQPTALGHYSCPACHVQLVDRLLPQAVNIMLYKRCPECYEPIAVLHQIHLHTNAFEDNELFKSLYPRAADGRVILTHYGEG